MNTTALPKLHRIPEAMERTGLSRSGLYRVINLGQLKVVKIGRSVRITEQDLADFINSLSP